MCLYVRMCGRVVTGYTEYSWRHAIAYFQNVIWKQFLYIPLVQWTRNFYVYLPKNTLHNFQMESTHIYTYKTIYNIHNTYSMVFGAYAYIKSNPRCERFLWMNLVYGQDERGVHSSINIMVYIYTCTAHISTIHYP